MKYAFIKAHTDQFSTVAMARALGVSRSAYYQWLARRERPPRASRSDTIDAQVRRVFDEHRARYGAPRITRQLRAEGYRLNEKTVAKSLRRQHLLARAARRFKATTDSRHDLPVYADRLGRDFSPKRANERWVQDITYCASEQGWMYLAVVIDLFSREIVGWSMRPRMTSDLVCDALKMALFRRRMPRGVIVHSDRGGQYCSRRYRSLLSTHGLLGSMSRRGNCYDNAVAESFFHTLKVERLHDERFATHAALRSAIFGYIERYYNTRRQHSTLGYVSPAAFMAANAA